jgi:DNA-binding MarR family transcriptional regulator
MPRPQNPNLNFHNLIVLVSKLRRKLDAQIEAELHYRGNSAFKSSYLPIFLLLYKEGSTTVQIAEHCGVTKQASSKLILEMSELGLLKSQINKEDRRSTIILLSAKGKRLATEVRKCLSKLTENYKSLMGKTKYEQMLELLEVLWILHE